ncbi:MAG: hypothetical protein HY319_16285 [Armatimonadetes bacterium]|nr:hypothetical protein [Armatimonadota bacterium]
MVNELELSSLQSGPLAALIDRAVKRAVAPLHEEIHSMRARIRDLEQELSDGRTRAFLQSFSTWMETEEGHRASTELLAQGVLEDELGPPLMRRFRESPACPY